jgi:hypothetical protein
LRYAPDDTSGVTQSIDNLMVRGRLLSNQQIGGTLTLQGSGGPNPTYEAALCVRAGANIQGLSQHGLLRVIGDSYMGGPVALSTMYGPVTLSNAPDAVPVDEVFTVLGTATTTALNTGVVNAAIVNAPLLNTDEFIINGYNGGPFGPAITAALVGPAVVSVFVPGGQKFQGVVVGTTQTILVCSTWGSGGFPFSLSVNDTVTVTVSRPGLGEKAFPAIVTKVSATANLALLTHTTIYTQTVAVLAPEDEATPLPDSPVIVGTGRGDLGTNAFVSGIVSEPSALMLYEYTSLHVSLPTLGAASIPDASIGAPIFDLKGQLLALVQYGSPNSVYTGRGAVFATVTGGVRANAISYFLSTPGVAGVVSFPVVSSSSPLPVRPIGRWERIPDLISGGLSKAAVGTTTDPATQIMTFASSATLGIAFPLGILGSNVPAFQDLLLQTPVATGFSVTYGDMAVALPPTTTTVTGTAFDTATYWDNLTPSCSPPSIIISGRQNMNGLVAKKSSITNLQFILKDAYKLRVQDFVAIPQGTSASPDPIWQFYITCGTGNTNVPCLQGWMFDNNSNNTTVNDAYSSWVAATSSADPSKLNVLFSVTYVSNPPSGPTWITYCLNLTPVSGPTITDVTVNIQKVTSSSYSIVINGSPITMIVDANEYDYFEYYSSTASGQPLCTGSAYMEVNDTLPATPSMTFTTASSSNHTVGVSIAAPTSLYP